MAWKQILDFYLVFVNEVKEYDRNRKVETKIYANVDLDVYKMVDNLFRRYISGNVGVGIDSFVNSIMGMSSNRREVLEYLEKTLNKYYDLFCPSIEDDFWLSTMFGYQAQKWNK